MSPSLSDLRKLHDAMTSFEAGRGFDNTAQAEFEAAIIEAAPKLLDELEAGRAMRDDDDGVDHCRQWLARRDAYDAARAATDEMGKEPSP